MKETIECDKKITFYFPTNIKGEHIIVQLPKHQTIEKSYKRLCEYMELHFKHKEEEKEMLK